MCLLEIILTPVYISSLQFITMLNKNSPHTVYVIILKKGFNFPHQYSGSVLTPYGTLNPETSSQFVLLLRHVLHTRPLAA